MAHEEPARSALARNCGSYAITTTQDSSHTCVQDNLLEGRQLLQLLLDLLWYRPEFECPPARP